jgi:hypothetical protein
MLPIRVEVEELLSRPDLWLLPSFSCSHAQVAAGRLLRVEWSLMEVEIDPQKQRSTPRDHGAMAPAHP